MTRDVTIAALQYACGGTGADGAERMARAAAGADVILIPELFDGPYFCAAQDARDLARAAPLDGHPLIARFADLARALGAVMPVSFFEADGNARFNSVAMIDADGAVLGVYRKSHIPQGPGYEEKFHFAPGDSGFRVWDTAAGRIGVGICWDQWFPEAARAMALMGAEMLLYPTAIGSEPQMPGYSSRLHWRAAMLGHAAANVMPLAAANRIGAETVGPGLTFYGGSFVAGPDGVARHELDDEEGIARATFDLDAVAETRAGWGVFRDRRPDLYGRLGAL